MHEPERTINSDISFSRPNEIILHIHLTLTTTALGHKSQSGNKEKNKEKTVCGKLIGMPPSPAAWPQHEKKNTEVPIPSSSPGLPASFHLAHLRQACCGMADRWTLQVARELPGSRKKGHLWFKKKKKTREKETIPKSGAIYFLSLFIDEFLSFHHDNGESLNFTYTSVF